MGSVSPDGSQIVYWIQNLTAPAYRRDLVVANADGSQPRVLYRAGEKVLRPEWAPDGHAIAAIVAGRPDYGGPLYSTR